MVGEELLLPIGVSLMAGLGRGIRGFVKYRKAEKSPFDKKKFLYSLGASVVFGAGIALLSGYFGLDGATAEGLVLQAALPWGLTDIAEDVVGVKKK